MVTRDRMADFRRGGETADHPSGGSGIGVSHYNPFEDVELGGSGAQQPKIQTTMRGHVAQASVHSTDQFLIEVDQLHLMMDKLEMQIQKLKIKQTTILGQTIVQPTQKDELESLISDIKQKTSDLRPHLKKLETELMTDEQGRPGGVEIRMRRDHCKHLKQKLRNLIDGFNETQIEYKQRVSKRVKRQLDLAGEHLSENEVAKMLDSKSSEVFYRQVNPLSVAGRIALEDATARHHEILDLERNIAQLQEVFEDVYELVHNQGEIVERIHTNVANAESYTGDANVRITKALVLKKSAQRKKLYCIIMVICVLLVLIAVAIVLGVTLSGRNQ